MINNKLTIRTIHIMSFFIFIILLCIYMFQIVCFDFFYERNQFNNISNIAKEIKKNVNDPELLKYLENSAYEGNICIRYVSGEDKINYNSRNHGCILQKSSFIDEKIEELKSNKDLNYINIDGPNKVKYILYLINIDDNSYIILNSCLENLDVATNILKKQLVLILVVLVFVGASISCIISRQITKPVIQLINNAAELKKGNYDVTFQKSDVAELNELADLLTVAASEMKNTDELRRDLIANVSHDLKTPLTMIKAYAEKVRDLSYKDEEKRNKDLSVIISESDRLNGLVNDLLDLSKLESNRFELNITKYDLVDQIHEVLQRYELLSEQEGYIFNISLPKDSIVINADRARLDQVFYNLINNAIEHVGKDKTVYIDVKSKTGFYSVCVMNTGEPIPKEEIPLVWNKYYTKKKNHKRNVVGTGIGLAIVKNILVKHDYQYGVLSGDTKYTKFYFKIPK